MTEFGDVMLERIAEALEKLNEKLIPIIARLIGDDIKGEKSVEPALKENVQHSINTGTISTDSKPWPKESSTTTATTVVESQNYVDVRECKDYSDKAYKLIGYDNLETYIAKQHVIRTESIEGGGTRVVVSQKSAWVIEKLEWK